MHKKLMLPKKSCLTCKKYFTWRKNGKLVGIMCCIAQSDADVIKNHYKLK
jgi:hypothetical protein